MNKEEFLTNFHLLLTQIDELIEEVDRLDTAVCRGSGFVVEMTRRYNPAEIITVNQSVTLYESLRNTDVLKKFVLESKTSTLFTCEQRLRERVQSLFMLELTTLADKCIEVHEPEPRELFCQLISRVTGRYASEIESGDYMMYIASWFKEQLTSIHHATLKGDSSLRGRYHELTNLITTTALLIDAGAVKNEGVGEKFTRHLNDYFKKMVESSQRERNPVL